MSIRDEIKSIQERNDLSPEEKTKQTYFAKGTPLFKSANNLLGKMISEDNFEITLTKAALDIEGHLLLWFTAERDGKKVTIPLSAFPFVIVNPPVGVRDSFGNVTENPSQALKNLLVSLVAMY